MHSREGYYNEREEEVEGEESGECSVIYGEATSNSLYKVISNIGDSRYKVRNYCGPPERYLSSG